MTAQQKRQLLIPLAILALIGGVLFARRTPAAASSPPVAGPSSALLEIQNTTLTSYLAAATSVQGVSPRVRHRGVGIDGAARSGSTHPMHLAGNPFGSVWNANQSLGGVKLATGAFAQRDVDLALPAEGPMWQIGRSFSNRQEDSSGAYTSSGYQGQNWFQTSQPEIVVYWDTAQGTKDADDVVYLVYGADAFLEFQRYTATSVEFKGMNGAAGMVEFVDGGADPDLYVYTDQWGYEFRFFGFDGDAGSAAGQFWKVTDPGGLCSPSHNSCC
jgi:hypothetical protein